MTEELEQKYKKPKIICPFCQERQANGKFRAFAVNGYTMHCRMMHPDKYDQYISNRDKYIAKFACDDEGNLTGSDPALEPVPEPIVDQEVISEQEYVELEEPKEIVNPTPPSTPPPVKIPAKQVPKKIKPEPEVPKVSKKDEKKAVKQEPEIPKEESTKFAYNPYGFGK